MADGYEVMANLWYKAIQEVYSNCWLTPPVAASGLNDSEIAGTSTTCEVNVVKFPSLVQIQKVLGVNDSNYQYVIDCNS
jgi:hypothetical protein